MSSTAAALTDVPVIDLAAAMAGDPKARARAGEEIDATCRAIGFLVVSGHGVPQSLIDEAFATSAAFFDLPQEEKDRFRPADNAAPRGYHALGTKNLARTLGLDRPFDLREQFYIGPLNPDRARIAHIPEAAAMYQDNIWPDRPAEWRDVFTRYYRALEALGTELMRLFALGLGLPDRYFDASIDNHFATLPSNNYPELGAPPLPGQLRAGEHTDFGSLTILGMNDAPGGLQVKMPNGEWRDVKAKRGQFIINIGDMMQRWTNDVWLSNLHRVVNPAPEDWGRSRRQTIGFFLHPNYDAEIASLPGCTTAANAAKYPPILAGELMRQKLQARAKA
jgi:isopenicillin N synthase-like dioxygenase